MRDRSSTALDQIIARINAADTQQVPYATVKWMCAMAAVEVHKAWERYVENRFAAALNHHPQHFLSEFNIGGTKRVSSGLAFYVIRGGKFFDFRSTDELIGKSTRLLGKEHNPFRGLDEDERRYIDALAAIRNKVVHDSDAATLAYKRWLRSVYDIRYAPEPPEFLNALDNRVTSPLRRRRRLEGLTLMVKQAIKST